MFHATLTLLVFVVLARPLAADRLVDGVPLPEDAKAATVAETAPAELRQWAESYRIRRYPDLILDFHHTKI